MLKDVVRGLQILVIYYGDEVYLDAAHDQIWCGDDAYEKAKEMTPEHRQALEDAHWFIDEEHDTWSKFV